MTTTNDLARERLLTWTPGGSQTASKAPGHAGPIASTYPAALARGRGALVWDYGGKSYVDWIGGLAAVALGHADPHVTRAINAQLHQGTLLSLPSLLEAEVAERLCAFAGGWAEQVRWVKTGSEAAAAAVRIARRATGREIVITVGAGYHGWHDWFQAVKPDHPGVPHEFADLLRPIRYGDWLVPSDVQDAACVILEPAPIVGGGDGLWLRGLRQWCAQHGVLLIFDEVVWGGRLAHGGGSEFFGVQPDLACFGKAIGNGVPIAAVMGRRDLMRHADVISGTYGGDLIGLVAALATMGVYRDFPVIERMRERGEALMDGVRQGIAHARQWADTGAAVDGYPCHPILRFDRPDAEAAMSLLLLHCARRGVLLHPGGLNPMHAHLKKHVAQTVDAVADGLAAVAVATARNTVVDDLAGAEPYSPAFARRV